MALTGTQLMAVVGVPTGIGAAVAANVIAPSIERDNAKADKLQAVLDRDYDADRVTAKQLDARRAEIADLRDDAWGPGAAVAAGGAALALGTGMVVAAKSLDEISESLSKSGFADSPDEIARGERFARRATVAAGIGAGLLVGGLTGALVRVVTD